MTGTSPQTAGSTAGAEPAAAQTLAGRVRRSFGDSSGSIVFGMEDGTVSIFGLVFGVARRGAGLPRRAAGRCHRRDQRRGVDDGGHVPRRRDRQRPGRVPDRRRARALCRRPGKADQDVHRRLVSAGFSDTEAATVTGIVGKHPDTRLKIAAAIDLGASEATRQNPYVQSAWMFITDLFAAAVPVVPFAVFSLGTARVVSLAVTFVLLVILGVGRARIGRRQVLPTVAQTVGIAMAAAVAGLLIGKLIS